MWGRDVHVCGTDTGWKKAKRSCSTEGRQRRMPQTEQSEQSRSSRTRVIYKYTRTIHTKRMSFFFKKKKKNRKGQGWGWERRGRALLSSWRAWQNISPSSCVSCKFFLKTRKRRGKVKIIFATFKSYLSTDIWNSTRFPGVHWFTPILPRDSVSYSQHHVHWEESLYLWK